MDILEIMVGRKNLLSLKKKHIRGCIMPYKINYTVIYEFKDIQFLRMKKKTSCLSYLFPNIIIIHPKFIEALILSFIIFLQSRISRKESQKIQ